MGSFLDVSNWLNPAKLTLYYQTNSSTQWVQDYCGQRATEPCEQICDQDTGKTTGAHTEVYLLSKKKRNNMHNSTRSIAVCMYVYSCCKIKIVEIS